MNHTAADTVAQKIEELHRLLLLRGWKLGVAESCTGGLLSSWIAQLPGISSVFSGAIVCYARQVKIDVLKVPERIILSSGEVSGPVARAMAQGANKALGSNWSVAITGIAGPAGGTPEKPVGTVCFALSGPGFEEVWRHQFPSHLERHEIQRHAAVFALDLLLSAMR